MARVLDSVDIAKTLRLLADNIESGQAMVHSFVVSHGSLNVEFDELVQLRATTTAFRAAKEPTHGM